MTFNRLFLEVGSPKNKACLDNYKIKMRPSHRNNTASRKSLPKISNLENTPMGRAASIDINSVNSSLRTMTGDKFKFPLLAVPEDNQEDKKSQLSNISASKQKIKESEKEVNKVSRNIEEKTLQTNKRHYTQGNSRFIRKLSFNTYEMKKADLHSLSDYKALYKDISNDQTQDNTKNSCCRASRVPLSKKEIGELLRFYADFDSHQ